MNKTCLEVPIIILQPSKFFIDANQLEELVEQDLTNLKVPVKTIGDKLVILDHHTSLKALLEQGIQSVLVYEDNPKESVSDFMYFCVEQNIRKITDIKIVTPEEYNQGWIEFCNQYNTMLMYK